MKQFAGAVFAAAVVASLTLVATGVASTSSTGGVTGAAKAAKLPALPPEVQARKRWIIGVKCDVPPFGYINVQGKNAGFDVEIGHWFARYAFGKSNRVGFVCAPTAAREPLLTADRVDLVISTFTYTRDRDTRIDFSRAYYKATGRLLVKNDSPIAFDQGRADTVMFDDTGLVVIAAADRTSKLTNDLFLALPYGIGIKQGNVAMKRWVDSRLNLMKKRDIFMSILRNNVPPRFLAGFSKNILRPNNNFTYAPETAPAPETVCP